MLWKQKTKQLIPPGANKKALKDKEAISKLRDATETFQAEGSSCLLFLVVVLEIFIFR